MEKKNLACGFFKNAMILALFLINGWL